MPDVKQSARFHLTYVMVALLGVILLHDLWERSQSVAEIPYSEFQTLLEQGKVQELTIGADRIQGRLKEERDGKSLFVTTRVDRAGRKAPSFPRCSPGWCRCCSSSACGCS
jgi:cell division protease FtsH